MGAVSLVIARRPAPGRAHLLRAIASEYREMPGMRLTPAQFGRLWNLDASQCEEVVQELIAARRSVGRRRRPHRRPLRRDVTTMAASVVLVDRDPLYAWFVTEALLAATRR